jgi:hypothetical protein
MRFFCVRLNPFFSRDRLVSVRITQIQRGNQNKALTFIADRDSGRWKLDAPIVEQRQTLFWELYFFLSLQVNVIMRLFLFLTDKHLQGETDVSEY